MLIPQLWKLIDHARAARRSVQKGHQEVELDPDLQAVEIPLGLLALNEAMDRLARWDPRQVQIVEMRFFAGLSFDEIAED